MSTYAASSCASRVAEKQQGIDERSGRATRIEASGGGSSGQAASPVTRLATLIAALPVAKKLPEKVARPEHQPRQQAHADFAVVRRRLGQRPQQRLYQARQMQRLIAG